jgi:hypothetical protein
MLPAEANAMEQAVEKCLLSTPTSAGTQEILKSVLSGL